MDDMYNGAEGQESGSGLEESLLQGSGVDDDVTFADALSIMKAASATGTSQHQSQGHGCFIYALYQSFTIYILLNS